MTNHPFLTAAETRTAHLRELSLHLRALEVEAADLADVEREIPELEAAMAVYRRLHTSGTAVANGPIPKNGEKPRAAQPSAPRKSAPSTRRASVPRRAETPSFKDFARTHIDNFASGSDAEGNGRGPNGDGFASATAKPPRSFPAS